MSEQSLSPQNPKSDSSLAVGENHKSSLPKTRRKTTQKREGKKSILGKGIVIKQLEEAFRNGATLAQAAMEAHCSLTALKRHKQEGTLLTYEGEEIRFNDLLEMWRGTPAYIAKKKIVDEIRKENSGTDDAWRLLERTERQEFGVDTPLAQPPEPVSLSEHTKAMIAKYRAGRAESEAHAAATK